MHQHHTAPDDSGPAAAVPEWSMVKGTNCIDGEEWLGHPPRQRRGGRAARPHCRHCRHVCRGHTGEGGKPARYAKACARVRPTNRRKASPTTSAPRRHLQRDHAFDSHGRERRGRDVGVGKSLEERAQVLIGGSRRACRAPHRAVHKHVMKAHRAETRLCRATSGRRVQGGTLLDPARVVSEQGASGSATSARPPCEMV